MCSRKLCCVPDFGDFCSWKCKFGVGMYACGACEENRQGEVILMYMFYRSGHTKGWTEWDCSKVQLRCLLQQRQTYYIETMEKEKQFSSVCCVHLVKAFCQNCNPSISHFLQSQVCSLTKCVEYEFTSLKAWCIMNYYTFQIAYSCCAGCVYSNSVWVTVMKSHLLTVVWLCSNRFGW